MYVFHEHKYIIAGWGKEYRQGQVQEWKEVNGPFFKEEEKSCFFKKVVQKEYFPFER